MARKTYFYALSLYLFGMLLTLCSTSEANQEKYFSKQLAEGVTVGEAVNLASRDKEFLAIYTKANEKNSRGGIILLHDLGTHADWPDIIAPLRCEFPSKAWNTLSLQLPILPDSALPKDMDQVFTEIVVRINSAINFYVEKGIYNLVLIGHGFGAVAGIKYLENKANRRKEIIAFVGISMYNQVYPINLQKEQSPPAHPSISLNIPVLDIYGSLDFEKVVESAKQRALAAKKSAATNFSQVELTGADHYFTGLSNTLIKRIGNWLNHQAPSMSLKLKK